MKEAEQRGKARTMLPKRRQRNTKRKGSPHLLGQFLKMVCLWILMLKTQVTKKRSFEGGVPRGPYRGHLHMEANQRQFHPKHLEDPRPRAPDLLLKQGPQPSWAWEAAAAGQGALPERSFGRGE